jgi:protein-S-isoprenylcysteine O-methyltransferase Ste14
VRAGGLSGLRDDHDAGALNLVADRALKRHATAVKPLGHSVALVTGGAFRLSRHPMYLLVLGFGLFLNRVFVRFEERKPEATFAQAWLDFTKQVRRWV